MLSAGSNPARANHASRSRADCIGSNLGSRSWSSTILRGVFLQGMFPKSVSRTSGKLRENKGNDMTEDGDSDAMLREKLRDVVHHLKNRGDLSFLADSALGQSTIWASERIAELESQTQSPETGSDEVRDAFFCLGYRTEMSAETTAISYCEAVAWGQDRIRHLERDLRDEQEVVGEIKKLELENEQLSLENESLSKTILAISKSPLLTSPDSEEEIHQRRRRERMLDEVTLICVRDGIERLPRGDVEEQSWGDLARDTATSICWGIDEFDAKQ